MNMHTPQSRPPVEEPTPGLNQLTKKGAGSGAAPPLPQDWTSTWLVAIVAAAMGFLATLGVAATTGVDALSRSWTDDLSARATVALTIEADDNAALAEALAALRSLDEVETARPLDDTAVAALVSPWIGESLDIESLPMPRLIDVELRPQAVAPAAEIEAALTALGVVGEVDAHGEWVNRLRPAARRIRGLAYGALGILAVASALVVALACSAGLAAQSKVIDVLKLVGAEDGYIARIFVQRLQILTFAGSTVGALTAAVALIAGGSGVIDAAESGATELAPLLPSLQPQGADWIWFAGVPFAFALIATAAAAVAVTAALRRREN
ncbi:MAG: hypothetical protein KTR21_02830 [Rhodobacteraceae bacterium]|nr:hypothetical protein [Paracoccaceae bacterium]